MFSYISRESNILFQRGFGVFKYLCLSICVRWYNIVRRLTYISRVKNAFNQNLKGFAGGNFRASPSAKQYRTNTCGDRAETRLGDCNLIPTALA